MCIRDREYIRDLFVIADYEKPKKLKAEFTVYKEHRKEYPYGMYIHWRPDDKIGEIYV